MDDAGLADLFARVRSGDPKAVSELIRRFEPEIRMFVRARLPQTLRAQYESMDFVQITFTSIYENGGVDFSRFESPQHLLKYLAGAARNSINNEYRRRTQTRKYNGGKQQTLTVFEGGRERPREVADSGPSPSQAAQVKDRLKKLLRGRSELERRIVDLRRGGLTFEEVGRELGIHESQVRRVVNELRERMARESGPWR